MSYNLGTAQGRIVIDGSDAEKGFGVASAAAQSFQSVLGDQMEAVDKIANRLLILGASGTTAMGVMTNSASGFEQRLSAIRAVSGATEEQMKAVSKAALEIGARTVYSATESAAAMEELIKAGLTVEDVLSGAADATVDLAAAGGIALPRAAEIAANAMNNFSLSGEDMPRIADLIAGAANASAIDVEQFGTSLSQVGAVAALTGMSFENTAVAIAELGNAGIKGSDAGTSLKTMFMNLIPSTDTQINKFRELGLVTVGSTEGLKRLAEKGIHPVSESYDDVSAAMAQYIEDSGGAKVGTAKNNKAVQSLGTELGALSNRFFDANGNIKDLSEVQAILAETTADMTNEQKLANLEILFGADAIRAAAVLSKEGADGYNAMAEAMGNVGAQEVAATRLDNLAGSTEQFRGALETLSIAIGTYFLAPARKMVDIGTSVLNFFNGMPDYVIKAAATLLSVATVSSVMLGTFAKLLPIMATLITRFLGLQAAKRVFDIFKAGTAVMMGGGGLTAAMAAMSTQTAALGGWLGTLLARSKVFLTMAAWGARAGAAVLAFATGPIGIAIGVVLALAALGKILYDKWTPFHDMIDKVGAALRDVFVPIVDQVVAAWNAFTNVLSGGDGGGELPPWIQAMIPAFLSIKGAIDEVVAVWNGTLWPAIQAMGDAVSGSFMSAWSSLVDTFQGSLVPALQNLWTVLSTQVWPAMVQFGEAIWPIVKVIGTIVGVLVGGLLFALFQVAMFVIGDVLPVFVEFAGWLAGTLLTVLGTVAGWIVEYLLTPFVKVVAWVSSKVVPVFQAIADGIIAALVWVRDTVGPILSAVGEWFSGLFDGAEAGAEKAGGVFSSIGQWFTDLWTSITAIAGTIFDVVSAPFVAIYNFIAPIISGIYNFIVPIWTAMFGLIANIAGLAWDIISGIWTIAALIFEGIFVNIGRGVSFVWGGLMDYLGVVWEQTVGKIQSFLEILSAAWSAVWGAISDYLVSRWENMKRNVSAAWEWIWGYISAGLDILSAAWNAVWGAITEYLSDKWENMKRNIGAAWDWIFNKIAPGLYALRDAWNAVWGAFTERVSDTWNSVKTAVSNGWKGVTDFFSGSLTMLATIGSDLIQGLINGINKKVTALRTAVSDIVSGLSDGIKKFFGIASPAKLTIKYGEYIAQGLTVGLNNETANLLKTARDMNSSVGDNLQTPYTNTSATPQSVHQGNQITLQVEWHAAPNDSVSTRQQLNTMLGRAVTVLGDDVAVSR